jgi:small conductance mechanosensitive channel
MFEQRLRCIAAGSTEYTFLDEPQLEDVVQNPGMLKTYIATVTPTLIGILMKLLIAVIILLIGIKVINKICKGLKKSMAKSRIEPGVSSFLSSLIRYILYFILGMFILGQFGVTTGSVVAVLGSAGLTIGLALQGSLSNFAGGVLILLLKPFVVGDYIVDGGSGKEGTVSEISIFYTKLVTLDQKMILIPNGTLSNSTITNVSKMEERRLEIVVGVAYDSDISNVKAILEAIAKSDEAVMQEREILVFVSELSDSSIEMALRVWVKNADYWTAKWRMTECIKKKFDENGISIPFPQLDVSIKKN